MLLTCFSFASSRRFSVPLRDVRITSTGLLIITFEVVILAQWMIWSILSSTSTGIVISPITNFKSSLFNRSPKSLSAFSWLRTSARILIPVSFLRLQHCNAFTSREPISPVAPVTRTVLPFSSSNGISLSEIRSRSSCKIESSALSCKILLFILHLLVCYCSRLTVLF